ncbi:MAG: hypothetical protein ACRC1D_03110 [Culicoidibacterales bacterium]
MRQVEYKKFIPIQKDENQRKVQGTGVYEDGFTGRAKFHGFGIEFIEFETGPGNFSVAILELEDGSVTTTEPKYIRFIS